MKINPLSGAVKFLNTVRERSPADGDAQDRKKGGNQERRDESDADEVFEKFVVDDEKVEQAIEAFGSDLQNSASGLTAARTGLGPGLKVILKDGTGAVVRQFTGEEFLKLRDAVTKEGRSRGKILDQKL